MTYGNKIYKSFPYLKWMSHWFFLPYRLLYLLLYYIICKILNVKNEGFKFFYDKADKVIKSGWLQFYDADKFWKELIISTICYQNLKKFKLLIIL